MDYPLLCNTHTHAHAHYTCSLIEMPRLVVRRQRVSRKDDGSNPSEINMLYLEQRGSRFTGSYSNAFHTSQTVVYSWTHAPMIPHTYRHTQHTLTHTHILTHTHAHTHTHTQTYKQGTCTHIMHAHIHRLRREIKS